MFKMVMYSFFLVSTLALQGCFESEKPQEKTTDGIETVDESASDEAATLFSFGGAAQRIGALTAKSDLGYQMAKKLTPKKYEKDLLYGNVEQQAQDTLQSGLDKAKKMGSSMITGANQMAKKVESKINQMSRGTALEAGLEEMKELGEKADAQFKQKVAPTLERGASEVAEKVGEMTAGSPNASMIAKKLTPRKYEPDFQAGQKAGY